MSKPGTSPHIILTLAGVLFVVTGCRMGPDYRRPEVAVPDNWRHPAAAAPGLESVANLAWWEMFQDPVLTNLIRTALENNRDIRIAAARVEQARGAYAISRSALFPALTGSAAWTRGRSGITGNTAEQFDILGLLSYEVDFWGRLRRLNEAARAQLLSSEEAHRSVYIGLIAAVASGYFSLRGLDDQLAIAQSTYVSRTNSLELTRIRYNDNNGIVSEVDVRQAETQVHAAENSRVELERAIASTENALSFLLGMNPGPIERGCALAEQTLSASVPAGLPSELLLRRPDILAAEQQLIAANANIGVARAAYFPTISITAALGLQSLDLDDLFNAGTSGAWNFSPQVVGPIFNGGRIRAGVRIAEAEKSEFLARYGQAIQNAFREVEDGLVAVAKLREQMAVGEAAVEAERRRVELSRDRYENGVTSYFEVLDAERSLFAAELSLVQTRTDLLSAMAQLYKALGGGWDERSAVIAANALSQPGRE